MMDTSGWEVHKKHVYMYHQCSRYITPGELIIAVVDDTDNHSKNNNDPTPQQSKQ